MSFAPRPGTITLVAIAGALGTVARYGVGRWLNTGLPWGTLAVNLLGALALGLVVGRVDRGAAEWVRSVAGTGFLGGFTTMSAFAVETDKLIDHRPGWAIAYLVATVVIGSELAHQGRQWAS